MNSLVTCKNMREETRKDPILSRVVKYLQCVWPHDVESFFDPFVHRKLEQGCLVWGGRVVIPLSLRENFLTDSHEGHRGVSRMKALGGSYVQWPDMDRDIEELFFNCETCQINQAMPQKAPVHHRERTNNPWVRIHKIDYAGPFHGKMFLIIVDSFSKWLEVIPTNNASSKSTIKALQHFFTTQGYPQVIISDNGSVFTSQGFTFFVKTNGIKPIKSPPYNSATNGCAKRAVMIFKTTMKKLKDIESMSDRLQMFLFQCRITPQSITGKSPAKLLMKRKLNKLSIIKSDAHSSEVSHPRKC